MQTDIREIENITFGVFSAEEILAMAVCEIDSSKKDGPGTVYDETYGYY